MQSPNAFLVTIFWQDKDSDTANCRIACSYALGYGNAEAYAMAFVVLASAISDAIVTHYTITATYIEVSIPSAPNTSDVRRRMISILFLQYDNAFTLSVPSVKQSAMEKDEGGMLTGLISENATGLLEYAGLLLDVGTDEYNTPIALFVTAGIAT